MLRVPLRMLSAGGERRQKRGQMTGDSRSAACFVDEKHEANRKKVWREMEKLTADHDDNIQRLNE